MPKIFRGDFVDVLPRAVWAYSERLKQKASKRLPQVWLEIFGGTGNKTHKLKESSLINLKLSSLIRHSFLSCHLPRLRGRLKKAKKAKRKESSRRSESFQGIYYTKICFDKKILRLGSRSFARSCI